MDNNYLDAAQNSRQLTFVVEITHDAHRQLRPAPSNIGDYLTPIALAHWIANDRGISKSESTYL